MKGFLAFLLIFVFTLQPCSARAAEETVPASDIGFEQKIADLRAKYGEKTKSQPANRLLSAIFLDWGIALYQRKNNQLAAEKLNQAVELDAENGPAWFILGDLAYLAQNDFKKAEYYWKKALPFAPPDKRREITERISRAAQDRSLEREHTSVETEHFSVRYSKDAGRDDAERIALYLEERHAYLRDELGIVPSKLTVIIYPAASFDSLTKGHDEILGLYDGRIRVPEPYLNTGYEKIILSHELAHAFLQHGYSDSLPIWVQEGYAQAKESGIRSTPEEAVLLEKIKDKSLWIPLEYLDRRFLKPSSGQDTTLAYLQSRYVVQYLVAQNKENFSAFLKALSTGSPVEKAFEESFINLKWNDLNHGRDVDTI